MPFSDQLHYPTTLGVRTSIARLALDPPWVGLLLAGLVQIGAASWSAGPRGHATLERVSARIRQQYADRDRFALVVRSSAGRTQRLGASRRSQRGRVALGAKPGNVKGEHLGVCR
jgi:hypothetical protein